MSDNPVSHPASDLTGKTLGQYEIGEQLGHGGMATVYLARQTSIGRTVAIKVMPAYFMGESNFLQRFEREVKVIAELQHPRVLPVYDYGQLEGRPYIVMAYMSGGTLADKIRQGQMPLPDVSRIVSQIAEGLDHAHHKGVIHRDFKPSNVLLDDRGNAYLADFGIAKLTETNIQLTGSGVVGTPAYMAPEMAESGNVTPSVDIYALGITLYQMLSGKYPYQGETPIRVMMAHAQDPVPDVREARPELTGAVANVVKKAMAKNPKDRHATAGALADDLRAALSGQPARASEPDADFDEGRSTEKVPLPAAHVLRPATPPPTPAPVQNPLTPLSAPTPMGAPTSALPVQTPKRGLFSNPVVVIGVVIGAIIVCVCGGFVLLGLINSGNGGNAGTTTGGGGTNGQANLVVDNQTSGDICKVFVAVAGSTGEGTEQLNGNRIHAGTTYKISGLETGQYDLKARDCEDNAVAEDYGITLAAGDFNWAINAPEVIDNSGTSEGTATGEASLVVRNKTGQALCVLYVREAGTSDWGNNQLGSGETIADQSEYTLNNIPAGKYDLRAESCDSGIFAEHFDADLSGEMTWTLSPSTK
jgi:serine/threonine protein kinase